ncbi:hypothetical protein C943_04045 [Mariniradius saccharolyticus AK6]|uniref:Uncharacterized protein n=1 Tax=Mariniradius saccharolyticus AK6 TaxID=1239962 RepID=M7Y0F7_9BACT|nr:hypothetical protein C943_04045 [Mariniradius saccharolyticus AK6]
MLYLRKLRFSITERNCQCQILKTRDNADRHADEGGIPKEQKGS